MLRKSFVPLGIRSEHSRKSLIRISELAPLLRTQNTFAAGNSDYTFSGHYHFYRAMISAGVKPLLGISVKVSGYKREIHLIANTTAGYLQLIRIFNLFYADNHVTVTEDQLVFSDDVTVIIPFLPDKKPPDIKSSVVYTGFDRYQIQHSKPLSDHCFFELTTCFREEDLRFYRLYSSGLPGENLLSSSEAASFPSYLTDATAKIADLCAFRYEDYLNQVRYQIPTSCPADFTETISIKAVKSGVSEESVFEELRFIQKNGLCGSLYLCSCIADFLKRNNVLFSPVSVKSGYLQISHALGISSVLPEKSIPIHSEQEFVFHTTCKGRELLNDYLLSGNLSQTPVYFRSFTRFKHSSAVRECARITEIPLYLAERISRSKESSFLSISEEKLLLFRNGLLQLENMIHFSSLQTGSFFFISGDITQLLPLEKDRTGRSFVHLDKDSLEQINTVRITLNSLKALDILEECASILKQSSLKQIELFRQSCEDLLVYELIRKDALGVFFLETGRARQILNHIHPENIHDLTLCTGFIMSRLNPQSDHFPELDHILLPFRHQIIFTETIYEILIFAGISISRALEIIRSLKNRSLYQNSQLRTILSSSLESKAGSNWTKLLSLMENNAPNCVSFSEALNYALISYQMAWMKKYFFREFFVSLMRCDCDNRPRLRKYASGLLNNGYKFSFSSSPSETNFTFSTNMIFPGQKNIAPPVSLEESAMLEKFLETGKSPGYFFELLFFGFFINCHPLSAFKDSLSLLSAPSIDELQNSSVRLSGIPLCLIEKNQHRNQEGSSCELVFSDGSDEIFASASESECPLIPGECYFAEAEKFFRGSETMLNVIRIMPLSLYFEQCPVYFHLLENTSDSVLEKLFSFICGTPGLRTVLIISEENERKTAMRAGQTTGVTAAQILQFKKETGISCGFLNTVHSDFQ